MQLDIKLSEAKSSIGIPTFKRDDLLRIALIDLSTLNQAGISQDERENYTTQYRRLAILGDALFDSVLINHLLEINANLTKKEIDDWRQEIATRDSLKGFAIELGLPDFSSSWNNKKRQSPEKEPNLWGEMFEAVIGAIFLDRECNFVELSQWLCDRFIHPVVACDVDQKWFEEHYGFADEPDMEMHPDYNW